VAVAEAARGQTAINQKEAAITADTMVVVETAASVAVTAAMATTALSAATTAASVSHGSGDGSADSGRGGCQAYGKTFSVSVLFGKTLCLLFCKTLQCFAKH
jgi:hypothetical protein